MQVATGNTSPEMRAVFQSRSDGRLTELIQNLREKKLRGANQDSSFLYF